MSNKASDYNTEINSDVFLEFWRKLFPGLKRRDKKCALVLEIAKYYTTITDDTRPPYQSWFKHQLVEAINSWGSPPSEWPPDWKTTRKVTKIMTLSHAKITAQPPKYKAKALAD